MTRQIIMFNNFYAIKEFVKALTIWFSQCTHISYYLKTEIFFKLELKLKIDIVGGGQPKAKIFVPKRKCIKNWILKQKLLCVCCYFDILN